MQQGTKWPSSRVAAPNARECSRVLISGMNFGVMIQRQRSKMGVSHEPAGPARGLKAFQEVVEVIRPSVQWHDVRPLQPASDN